MQPMSTRRGAASALLALLCAWQVALPLAFFLQMRITELPCIALGALVRSEVPIYAMAGLLVWILAHELAHASAARCCGVQGGRIQWSTLLPAFRAPAQTALERSDTRFLIYSAGPVLDLLCSLSLATAALLAAPGPAAVLQGLFVISLLLGLPNCCMLTGADMGQGMREFRRLCGRGWPSILYGILSLTYASVVALMAVKLLLRSRPGIV